MKLIAFFSILMPCVLPYQTSIIADEACEMAVEEYKWTKRRIEVEKTAATTAPAEAMLPENKNFERGRRLNAPPGTPDPNENSMDRRRANMEKMVQEARTPQAKTVDGYAYRVKVRNIGKKVAEVLFIEYQFIEAAKPNSVARRQFLCGVNIKPDKAQELQAFSVAGPSDVISVASLAKTDNIFKEQVLINRVEFSDGTIWQRKGWNFGEVRLSLKAVLATPWGAEMCRGL